MRFKFEGLFPVLPTPMHEDETADLDALDAILEHVLVGGADGVWVLGSGGELPNLYYDERAKVIEATVKTVAGRVPVVIGVGNTGTKMTIAAARQAKEMGASAINVVPPYYHGYNDTQMHRHYQLILDAVDIPTVIYRRGTPPMSFESLEVLCQHPNVIGIKDVPTEFREFQRMVAKFAPLNVSVMTAAGRLIHTSTAVGGAGTTAVECGIAMNVCRKIYDAAKASNNQEAAEWQQKLYALSLAIMVGPDAMAAAKMAYHLLGLCKPCVAEPLEPITDKARIEQIRTALTELDLLKDA